MCLARRTGLARRKRCDMVPAMRAPSPLAACLVVTAASLLVACSKPNAGPSPSGSGTAAQASSAAAPAPAVGGACDVVTCANFMGAPDYAAGRLTTLASMPAPPPASTLCGGSISLRSNYYTTTLTPEQVIAYYEKELPGLGFTVKPRQPGIQPCSLTLSFRKEKLQLGNISAFVGGFSVLYAAK